MFGHLDIRVAQELRDLVEIAAVHNVPGRESVTEVVETKVFDLCQLDLSLIHI